jgi:hypothetical protein
VSLSERTTQTASTSDELGWPAHVFIFAISQTFRLPEFRIVRLNFKPLMFNVVVTAPLSADQRFAGWRIETGHVSLMQSAPGAENRRFALAQDASECGESGVVRSAAGYEMLTLRWKTLDRCHNFSRIVLAWGRCRLMRE